MTSNIKKKTRKWLVRDRLKINLTLIIFLIILLFTIPLSFFMLYNDLQDVVNKQYAIMENRVAKAQIEIIESGGLEQVNSSFFDGSRFTGESLSIDEGDDGDYDLVSEMPPLDISLKEVDIAFINFLGNMLFKNRDFPEHEHYTSYPIDFVDIPDGLTVTDDGKVYLTTSHTFESDGVPYLIDMTRDITTHIVVPLDTFTLNFAIMLLWLFLLTIFGIAFCLRIIFNPLEKAVTSTFDRIDMDQLHTKIEDPHYGIEVSRIVSVFNDVLAKCSDLAETNVRTMQDVSHEVRTHLTAIKQSVDIIKRYGADDQQMVQARLASIEINIERATDVMEAILDLARLQHSPKPKCEQEHSTLDLWENYTHYKKKRYIDQQIHVRTDLTEEDNICIDKEHFYLALNPIFDNAVKYSVDSNTILIKASRNEEGSLEVSVTNNGRYIEEEEIPNLFDRYYRGTNIGNVKNGSGLGLTITKEVMNIYKGDIRVESEKSGRTTFTLIFPNKPLTSPS